MQEMICKECGNCSFFANGEDYDFCELNDEPVECCDNACEDFEER